jgi:uncharacterized protein with HEPN domain
MPDREPAILIEDIRTAIEKIDRYTAGVDLETFLADEMIVDAVVRNLEIVGEADGCLMNSSNSTRRYRGHKSPASATGSCIIISDWICS